MESQPAPLSADAGGAAPQDPSADHGHASFAPASTPRYCPTALLAGFALLMAGHGRCVNTDMMLGDAEYAMWQLSCAKAMDDAELSEVTMRLYAYFDDVQHSAMPVLGTA